MTQRQLDMQEAKTPAFLNIYNRLVIPEIATFVAGNNRRQPDSRLPKEIIEKIMWDHFLPDLPYEMGQSIVHDFDMRRPDNQEFLPSPKIEQVRTVLRYYRQLGFHKGLTYKSLSEQLKNMDETSRKVIHHSNLLLHLYDEEAEKGVERTFIQDIKLAKEANGEGEEDFSMTSRILQRHNPTIVEIHKALGVKRLGLISKKVPKLQEEVRLDGMNPKDCVEFLKFAAKNKLEGLVDRILSNYQLKFDELMKIGFSNETLQRIEEGPLIDALKRDQAEIDLNHALKKCKRKLLFTLLYEIKDLFPDADLSGFFKCEIKLRNVLEDVFVSKKARSIECILKYNLFDMNSKSICNIFSIQMFGLCNKSIFKEKEFVERAFNAIKEFAPQLLDTKSRGGDSVMHRAVSENNEDVVRHLYKIKPKLLLKHNNSSMAPCEKAVYYDIPRSMAVLLSELAQDLARKEKDEVKPAEVEEYLPPEQGSGKRKRAEVKEDTEENKRQNKDQTKKKAASVHASKVGDGKSGNTDDDDDDDGEEASATNPADAPRHPKMPMRDFNNQATPTGFSDDDDDDFPDTSAPMDVDRHHETGILGDGSPMEVDDGPA